MHYALIHDPLAHPPEATHEYGVSLSGLEAFKDLDGLVIAVTTVAAYWVALALTRKRFRA